MLLLKITVGFEGPMVVESEGMKLLIIKLSSLGDVIWTLPGTPHWKKNFLG
jgi:hypothetical protein